VVEQPIRKLRQRNVNKQDSSRIQQLSCPSQPITTHHFRSYNAKTTQAGLLAFFPRVIMNSVTGQRSNQLNYVPNRGINLT